MWDKLGRAVLLLGVLFVALFVAGIILTGSTPGSDAPGKTVISFYQDNKSKEVAGNGILGLGGLFFLFFAGAVWGRLRRSEEAHVLAVVGFAGAVMVAVGASILTGLGFALTDVPDKLDPSAAQALNILGTDLFFTLVVGGAAFSIATGLAIVRSRTLWPWFGWVGVVIGVPLATPLAVVAGIVFLLWVLVLSILLFMRSEKPALTPIAEATAT